VAVFIVIMMVMITIVTMMVLVWVFRSVRVVCAPIDSRLRFHNQRPVYLRYLLITSINSSAAASRSFGDGAPKTCWRT
jgi:hypothetical protein